MDLSVQATAPTPLLIADDELAICRLIGKVAEELGYAAHTVQDGDAFKHAYARVAPRVIFLDLSIPGADGIELLRFLADQQCEARIVMISGHGQRVLESAQRLGGIRGLKIAGILTKPFRRAELHAELTRLSTVA